MLFNPKLRYRIEVGLWFDKVTRLTRRHFNTSHSTRRINELSVSWLYSLTQKLLQSNVYWRMFHALISRRSTGLKDRCQVGHAGIQREKQGIPLQVFDEYPKYHGAKTDKAPLLRCSAMHLRIAIHMRRFHMLGATRRSSYRYFLTSIFLMWHQLWSMHFTAFAIKIVKERSGSMLSV